MLLTTARGGFVRSVPDGKALWVGTRDGVLHKLDATTGAPLLRVDLNPYSAITPGRFVEQMDSPILRPHGAPGEAYERAWPGQIAPPPWLTAPGAYPHSERRVELASMHRTISRGARQLPGPVLRPALPRSP